MKKYFLIFPFAFASFHAFGQTNTAPSNNQNTGISIVAANPDGSSRPAKCQDFQRDDQGRWTPLTLVAVINNGHQVMTAPAHSMSFPAGSMSIGGVDLGGLLEQKCLKK